MEVLDLPEGLDELLNVPIDRKCICDLSEARGRRCVRVISFRTTQSFKRRRSKFLQLDPPTDLYEALNSLMIFYKHVPEVLPTIRYMGPVR